MMMHRVPGQCFCAGVPLRFARFTFPGNGEYAGKGMNVRANSSMRALLGPDAEFPERVSLVCPSALIAGLGEGFKEVDGCVVPRQFGDGPIWSPDRPRIDNQDDETGFECGLSKVHIEDFVSGDLPLADMTRYGVAYALRLREALRHSDVTGLFRIIVDAQLPDADSDVLGSICTVRYHKIRKNQVWADDDLDGYKLNALLIMDFEATQS